MFALKATQFTLTKNPKCSRICAKDDTSGSIYFAMNEADQILLNFHYTVNTLLVVGGNRKSSKDYKVPPSKNDTFLCQ